MHHDPKPYPKWITAPDGRPCIVPDAQTERAVMEKRVEIPEPPRSAQGEHPRVVPSIGCYKHFKTE